MPQVRQGLLRGIPSGSRMRGVVTSSSFVRWARSGRLAVDRTKPGLGTGVRTLQSIIYSYSRAHG